MVAILQVLVVCCCDKCPDKKQHDAGKGLFGVQFEVTARYSGQGKAGI